MPIDDATWAQVRAAYADTKVTVVEICHQFGIRHQDLYARRSVENWPLRDKGKSDRLRRVPASKSDQSASGDAAAKPHATTSRAARAALILRLYNAIDLKLTQMEKLMSHPETAAKTSSADPENPEASEIFIATIRVAQAFAHAAYLTAAACGSD